MEFGSYLHNIFPEQLTGFFLLRQNTKCNNLLNPTSF
nr:MAG TPA: hypothetical protein [Caudoviricetes sp.]